MVQFEGRREGTISHFNYIWIRICRDVIAQLDPISQTRKCEMLFMCPTFCMKMKDGCYVCDCSALSKYMEDMSKEVQNVANNGISQTGTEAQTMPLQAGDKKPTTQGNKANILPEHDQFVDQGLGRFLAGSDNRLSQTGWNGMQQDNYFNNLQSFIPDFKAYNAHLNDGLPGMNCPSIRFDCPAECWRTDIITGCLDCSCGGMDNTNFKKTTQTPTAKIKSLPTGSSTKVYKTEAAYTTVSREATLSSTASTTVLNTSLYIEPKSDKVTTPTSTPRITPEIDTTTPAKTTRTTISLSTSSTILQVTPSMTEHQETTTQQFTTTQQPTTTRQPATTQQPKTTRQPTTTQQPKTILSLETMQSTPSTTHSEIMNILSSNTDNGLTSHASGQLTANSTEIDQSGLLTGMNTDRKAQTGPAHENGTLLNLSAPEHTSPSLVPTTPDQGPCPPFKCNTTCGNRPYERDARGCSRCVSRKMAECDGTDTHQIFKNPIYDKKQT
ncbi:hypothetical protein ACJMK2_026604 [Sinanodonta woodiana]|uniref:Uncharacterized protein n=1 Tax=Sinanodonta woodiana TaxID=1069815 RepID=A0ABD3XLZ6_SINWO